MFSPSCYKKLFLWCLFSNLGVQVHGKEGASTVEDRGHGAHERGQHDWQHQTSQSWGQMRVQTLVRNWTPWFAGALPNQSHSKVSSGTFTNWCACQHVSSCSISWTFPDDLRMIQHRILVINVNLKIICWNLNLGEGRHLSLSFFGEKLLASWRLRELETENLVSDSVEEVFVGQSKEFWDIMVFVL